MTARNIDLNAGPDDPLNGVWVLNLTRSWAPQGDRLARALLTFAIKDDVEEFTAEFAAVDGPLVKMVYTARYGRSDEWQPCTVLAVDGGIGPAFPRVGAVGPTRPGDVLGEVIVVKVDARTRYRLTRTTQGNAANAVLLRLSEDGETLDVTLFDLTGSAVLARSFDRG